MWFRHLGRPAIEQHSQSLGVSRPLYTTRVTRLSLWVCERLWHASVNTVHIRHCELAPAGTDEAAGETVCLRGAVAVACAVLQLLPLRAGVRE